MIIDYCQLMLYCFKIVLYRRKCYYQHFQINLNFTFQQIKYFGKTVVIAVNLFQSILQFHSPSKSNILDLKYSL